MLFEYLTVGANSCRFMACYLGQDLEDFRLLFMVKNLRVLHPLLLSSRFPFCFGSLIYFISRIPTLSDSIFTFAFTVTFFRAVTTIHAVFATLTCEAKTTFVTFGVTAFVHKEVTQATVSSSTAFVNTTDTTYQEYYKRDA